MRKALATVGDKLHKSPFLEFGVGFTVVLASIWLGFGVFNLAESAWYKSRPATDFFNYESVEFVKVDGNSLVFASTRIVKDTYPFVWNDVLFCDDGREYRFYSNQESKTQNPELALEYRTVQWNYQSAIPKGRECYLESQITMTVRGYPKKQVVESEKFYLN